MKKAIGVGLAAVLLACLAGCAAPSKERPKDSMTRCPKCAQFYSTKEGVDLWEYMKPR